MLGDGVAAGFLAGCFVRTRPRRAPGRRPYGRRSGRASRRRRRRKTREPRPWSCSTLRCEARFSIGRIARKLRHETPLRRGMRTGKTRAQNPARVPWLWLGFCKASCAAKVVAAASRTHRDVTFSRHAVTPALVLATSRKNTQSLRCAPNPLRLRAHRCLC